ncbi:MAG TPA: cytochrome P450 [Jatrophihabitans sp.]|nr:cytochrome P450 [Jatrophihabitans sp.]
MAERAERFPIGATVTIERLTADPHPVLAQLREHEPVSWIGALSGWLVTRHDLAEQVMRDPVTFTVDDPRFSTAQVLGPSMLSLDGPPHSRHRAPFAAAFRPAEVRERFTGFVHGEAARLIAVMKAGQRAELRRALAGPLSVAVLAESLGLPDADPATVLDWYAAIVGAVSAITAGRPVQPAAAEAVAALRDQVQHAVGLQRAVWTGRSLLGQAAADLSLDEVVSNAAVLMFGGIDTTEGMLANLVGQLLTDRRRWTALLDDPDLIPAAIEESLRLEPAAAVVDRYATRSVRLAAADIEAGEPVTVSIAGVNRDPAVFDDPNRFDPHRPNLRRQLAFARGPHFCLGMDLARLQARIVLRLLLAELPGLRLAPGRPPEPVGLVFRKPADVWLEWA